jgi:hypothetical protein
MGCPKVRMSRRLRRGMSSRRGVGLQTQAVGGRAVKSRCSSRWIPRVDRAGVVQAGGICLFSVAKTS